MLGTLTKVFPLAMCWALVVLYTPKWHLSCSPHWHLICTDQFIYHVPEFLLSQLLLATGKLLISADTDAHPVVLRIFQFIKSIFSSSPVSKSIPSPFHVICKFNKHTVYSIIHSVNKNAGKIRYRFRRNLHIELLVTFSIWTGSLYKSSEYSYTDFLCFHFVPMLACWSR